VVGVTEDEGTRRGGWAERGGDPVEPLDFSTRVPVAADGPPLSLHLVFADDGLYVPAVVRRPPGPGPHPAVVCLHGGSGGLGIPWLVDHVRNRGALLDRLLEADYAVCVTEGRREREDAYGADAGGVLDHEDVRSVLEYLRDRPFVDADRVGFVGTSHGGELQLKVAAGGGDPAALVALEPAVIEFLGLRYEGPRREETLQFHDRVTDEDIDLERARERIARIDDDVPVLVGGRDADHLQGLFRKLYELLDEAGTAVEWASWDHPEHAYQWGPRRTGDAAGADGGSAGYDLDETQRATVETVVSFLAANL
jgi:dienelactone hydrolase